MNTLCRIREVSRAIAEFEQCFEREYRQSMNEGVLLCCLARHGELSSGEIAEMLRLTCSNTSKVIRSVEGKGFVIRKLGEEDKRQMYFSLTEAGRAELERLQPETHPDFRRVIRRSRQRQEATLSMLRFSCRHRQRCRNGGTG